MNERVILLELKAYALFAVHDTDLVTSGSFETRKTNTFASFRIALGAVPEVTIANICAIYAIPSTGAFIFTIFTKETGGTVTLSIKTTALRTIPTEAFTRAVHTKPAFGAGSLATLTFESGRAHACSFHVITHSTILASASSTAVAPVGSLRTRTFAVNSYVSVSAATCAISPVTRMGVGPHTLAGVVAVGTVAILGTRQMTRCAVVTGLAAAGPICNTAGMAVLTLATLTAVFTIETLTTLLLAPVKLK